MMESIACNLCGQSDHRVVYQKPDTKYFPKERFSAVECLNCGLGYVNPRPAFSEMSRYYPVDFYEYFDTDPAAQMKRYRVEASYLKEFARSAEGRKRLWISAAPMATSPTYDQGGMGGGGRGLPELKSDR